MRRIASALEREAESNLEAQTASRKHLAAETAAAVTADRYFKTGDPGKLDSDGFLYVTGRKKDLIIVAGKKVGLREIEETLMAHPAVAKAADVGSASATRGEIVTAFASETASAE